MVRFSSFTLWLPCTRLFAVAQGGEALHLSGVELEAVRL